MQVVNFVNPAFVDKNISVVKFPSAKGFEICWDAEDNDSDAEDGDDDGGAGGRESVAVVPPPSPPARAISRR